MTDNHLSAEDLAAYHDRTLGVDWSAGVEAHLAECADCRGDLVAARRALASERSIRPGVMVPVIGLAAALLLGVPALLHRRPPAPADSERGSPRAAIPIEIIAPSENAHPSRDAIRFIWNGAGPRAQYRLTVTDSTGGSVWSAQTADTLVVPDSAATLSEGTAYFWFVDALRPDGRSRTSGTHRFTIPR